MAYHNILVPVDGSEPSFEALRKALKIFNDGETKTITVLYVIPKTSVVEAFGSINLREAFEKEGRLILGKAVDIAEDQGVSLSVRMSEGIPCEKIIETARTLSSNLIVMGSRKLTDPYRFLTGSCTRMVFAKAPCPVMVIKKQTF
jgi:nucleotide-binding universal stress UspA family protein